MITIESLVEQGANVKLEVTPADLKMFAESIVQRTIMAQQEEQRAAILREAEETQVDKDRHENRRITPSGRDVRRGNGKKEKDSDRSGGSNKSNSKERTAVRMRTV